MLERLTPLGHLKLRWFLVLCTYLLVIVSSTRILFPDSPRDYILLWSSGSVAALSVHLGILWWGLERNYRHRDGVILHTFGYGNAITLARGMLISLLAGFLFTPEPQTILAWLPALFYTLACIFDYLDGYVARITNHSTVLGEILDMEFDGLGILVAIGVAIRYGQLPFWYLLLGLGRQLFLLGIWIRKKANLPVYEMSASENRRIIAGTQMGFICVILWPILKPPLTHVACVLFSVPLLASFCRDWLVVSGYFRLESRTYQTLIRLGSRVVEQWGPFICRIAGGFICIWLVWLEWPHFHGWSRLTDRIQPAIIQWVWHGILLCLPIFIATFVFGIGGRLSALLLLIGAFTEVLVNGLQLLSISLFVALVWVVQFGSGSLALWKAEERFLRRRAGAERTLT